jgi:hypothetical protein
MKKAILSIIAVVIVLFIFIVTTSLAGCEGHTYFGQMAVETGLLMLSLIIGILSLILFLAAAIYYPFSKKGYRIKLIKYIIILCILFCSGFFLALVTRIMTHLTCAPSINF